VSAQSESGEAPIKFSQYGSGLRVCQWKIALEIKMLEADADKCSKDRWFLSVHAMGFDGYQLLTCKCRKILAWQQVQSRLDFWSLLLAPGKAISVHEPTPSGVNPRLLCRRQGFPSSS
jgi:hypothetical protein